MNDLFSYRFVYHKQMERVMANFQINVQSNAAVNYHLSSLFNLRIDQCGIYNHSTINNHANIYIYHFSHNNKI